MPHIDPNASIEIECTSATPGMRISETSDLVRLVKRLSGVDTVSAASYNTEAGLFQEAGIPTVVCGPGDIVQAHRPNEFVSLEQLARCEAFMNALMESD